MSRKKHDRIDAGYYAVAFIDLMGQQDRLRQLKTIPNRDDHKEVTEFTEALRNTYSAVDSMRRTFNQFFSTSVLFKIAPALRPAYQWNKVASSKT